MKLFTKGLLLIAMPSVVELALLGAVFDTQQQTARAALSAANSERVLYEASALLDPLLREVARVRTAMVTGDPAFIDRRAAWIELGDRLDALERMVGHTPQQSARLARMRVEVDSYHAQAEAISQALHAHRSIASYRDLETGELPVQAARFRDELDSFDAEATRLAAAHRASLTRTRMFQQDALIAAVLGSMLIWGVAALIFARSIGRRLAVLIGNANRLGLGQPLSAPLTGNDEIAGLDAALHQTGARLRASDAQHAELKVRLEARAKELAEVNEALRQETQDNEMFIYSVSHDLRSPLVNLQGFSKELEVSCAEVRAAIDTAGLPEHDRRRFAAVLDGDMRESLDFLRSAVTRAAAIIEALLRISRAGRMEFHWQRVSIGRAVARVTDAMAARIDARGARVTVRELPPAWGDPGAIEEIFGHLLGNALNFLDPGRAGRIEIGACDPEPPDAQRTGAPRTRTYYVRDNGLGIPAACTSKVFRAFQRLHGDVAPGDGIGLALTRRIVERHGGRVWVESAEGAGSTFFVALPEQPMRP
jgi:signal transduction histidine kinase